MTQETWACHAYHILLLQQLYWYACKAQLMLNKSTEPPPAKFWKPPIFVYARQHARLNIYRQSNPVKPRDPCGLIWGTLSQLKIYSSTSDGGPSRAGVPSSPFLSARAQLWDWHLANEIHLIPNLENMAMRVQGSSGNGTSVHPVLTGFFPAQNFRILNNSRSCLVSF